LERLQPSRSRNRCLGEQAAREKLPEIERLLRRQQGGEEAMTTARTATADQIRDVPILAGCPKRR
jgi:hypothetical protein